ncbi:MAG: biotin/lipoyl-binding protein [Gammaproteobacteria bacterium]|nr:biotin/lipoyl-binding protein [Gammaproteobacteria bacterium]
MIQANGRIEGDTIIIASKQPGRVTAVHVHDGDAVDAGQVLIELDDRAARARVAVGLLGGLKERRPTRYMCGSPPKLNEVSIYMQTV